MNTWVVRVTPEIGVPVESQSDVIVPNPVSFIAQKILFHTRRPPKKKAQDALYIHDTLELFGGDLAALKKLWLAKVRPTLTEKTARNVERLQREYFAEVNDVIRNAIRIPQDRVLKAERMRATCANGLGEIFGE